MLIEIDKQKELFIDDSMILLLGEEGLRSSFTQTRINEGIKKGSMFDISFKKGKRSLILYPSGQSIITHISATQIEKLKTAKVDDVRQLRIDIEVMKLKLAKLMNQT